MQSGYFGTARSDVTEEFLVLCTPEDIKMQPDVSSNFEFPINPTEESGQHM